MASLWRRRKNPLDEILKELQSASKDSRRAAVERLRTYSRSSISADEVNSLIEAAALDYSPLKLGVFDSVEEVLLAAALNHPSLVDPSIVVRTYPMLNERARATALQLLARNATNSAYEALAGLLHNHALLPGDFGFQSGLGDLAASTPAPELLVPALVAGHGVSRFTSTAATRLLDYAGAQKLGENVDAVRDLALARVAEALEVLEVAESDVAINARNIAGLYLDLVGTIGDRRDLALLRSTAKLKDPWVVLWAAVGLRRFGDRSAAAALKRAAADPLARYSAYWALKSRGWLADFPAAFNTQPLLAEAEMVDWLNHPGELGEPPDEIQLIETRTYEAEDGECDLFVFRFRKEEAGQTEPATWKIGVAGPYLKKEQPTLSSLGFTFSRFEDEDDASIEDHVAEIEETLVGWMEAEVTELHRRET